ncbi:MAG: bifunctional metallophosphatase/5'-nucleotidase [Gammaproteobacteria bacterium]|nr:bifunctional metallophosphatase/5'-nucleotidase [Gammaproteobacteria bacterium]
MKRSVRSLSTCAALVLSLGSTIATAGPPTTITLMQFSDLHGKMVPHQEIFQGDRAQNYSGGLTKMATAIGQVRADDPDALLLMVGDTTHGSAETLFTMGESVMAGLNSLDIDAFTPGNWDFGHGPRAFRNRFAGGIPGSGGIPLPLPPNNRTTLTGFPGKSCPGLPGTGPGTGQFTCNVTAATFDTVAINLYNYNEGLKKIGPRVLPPFKMLETNGVKVAVIGITTDVVPQQAATFNIGFRFTMGHNELPGIVADARAAGADVVVVQSELGLSKNLQMVKEIPGVDVMFSGHTHERTHEALIVKHKGNQTIVTEAGEDTHLGRLELTIQDGAVKGFDWELIELDDSMPEDPAMVALVDPARANFLDGTCHTFGPGGFGYGQGHTLCDSIETVVGSTDVTLERRDVLEDISNNFMVDAFVEAGRQADPNLNADNSLSTTNGFRYDNVVLGNGTVIGNGPATASGDISIADLYAYYPIGAALALASYSGGRLFDHYEGILSHVFDPNPYRQRGGWNLGFTENMHFDIDLVDLPLSISYPGRITNMTINGAKFDRSKTFTVVSCYPHGNPVDEACRTSGAFNFRFMTGTQDGDGVVTGPYSWAYPVNDEDILDPLRAPVVLQAAPNNFVHPVNILREYLATNVPNGTTIGAVGRVNAIHGNPVSDCDPTLVQPVQGAGPSWLARDDGEGACQDNGE